MALMKKIGNYFMHDGLQLDDGSFCDMSVDIYDDDGTPVYFVGEKKVPVVEYRYDGCTVEYFDTWACTDGNHWGVVFESRDKEKLQKFSDLLEEEGAAMSNIVPAYKTDLCVCDIDQEWDGSEYINPFYFWYYGADDENEEELEAAFEQEEDPDEDPEAEEDAFWDYWDELEDRLLGR